MPSTPDPASEADPRLPLAKEFFLQLRKAVKTIGMYRHQTGRHAEILAPALASLQRVLDEGPLPLKVTAESFCLGEEPLWAVESGESIPYRFFREGVRQLLLRPGLTEAELLTFVGVMLTSTERTGDDCVALLWNAGLEHLDYVVVEGFSVGELSEAQVQAEVDSIVEYLTGRLRSDTDDAIHQARIAAEDLELKLEGIEAARGVVFEGEGVSPAYQSRLQAELAADVQQRLPRQLGAFLAERIVQGFFPDPTLPAELLTHLLDELLLHEELGPVVAMLDLLGTAARDRASGGQAAAAVLTSLGARMSEEHRVRRLGEALRHNRGLDLAAAGRYLAALTPQATEPLLDVLGSLESLDHRNLCIDALARLGKDRVELFTGKLGSEKSQTVRDMIAILEKGSFPNRHRHMMQVLKNPNPMVRMEVISLLATAKNEELAFRMASEAMADKSAQVRLAAYRAAAAAHPAHAVAELLKQTKAPDWDKREPREKEALYEALGRTHQPSAQRHLQGLLAQKKTLLTRARVLEGKLLAVAGLQGMASLQSFKLLQKATEAGEEPEVVAAAQKAMAEVKRRLTQDAEAGQAFKDKLYEAHRISKEREEAHRAAEKLYEQFETASAKADKQREVEQQELAAQAAAREAAEQAAAVAFEASLAAERQRALEVEQAGRSPIQRMANIYGYYLPPEPDPNYAAALVEHGLEALEGQVEPRGEEALDVYQVEAALPQVDDDLEANIDEIFGLHAEVDAIFGLAPPAPGSALEHSDLAPEVDEILELTDLVEEGPGPGGSQP